MKKVERTTNHDVKAAGGELSIHSQHDVFARRNVFSPRQTRVFHHVVNVYETDESRNKNELTLFKTVWCGSANEIKKT